MEMWEGKEAESSNNRDWDELFNLFNEVFASEKQELKIPAIVKLAKMSKDAPENKLELVVPMLLELLESPQGNLSLSARDEGDLSPLVLENLSSSARGESDSSPLVPENLSLSDRGEGDLSPLVLEASAYCLKCISSRGEGILVNLIGQPRGVSTFLSLLPISGEGLLRDLLKCLRNVVTFCTNSRSVLVSHGGLQIVLDKIDNCFGESKLILLEILSALALIEDVRTVLLSSDRVHLLVKACRHGSMISRTRAAQAIGLLAMTKRVRRLLVVKGAIQVLFILVNGGDTPAKLVAGNALGVIFSCVKHIKLISTVQSYVISFYIELLQGSDVTGREIATDVLCVLAFFEENAVPIIEQLVRILRGHDLEAKSAAASVIWGVSSHKYSFPVLQKAGAVSVLVELLEDESIVVREKAAGAIARLSQNVADRAFLANCGAIPHLINVLDSESDELRDNAAEALVDFSLDSSLGDQISCIVENPVFQNMRDRVMEIRASDEHTRRTTRDELNRLIGGSYTRF